MAILLLPLSEHRQKLAHILFVADEIVIDNKNRPAPSQVSQRIKLGQHLRVAFCPGYSTVDFNDVAELATEGTSSRVLDRHSTVALQIGEMKVGHWSDGKRRTFGCFVELLCCSLLQIADKLRYRRL